MVFTIRQNATLPILKLKVIKDGRNDFNEFYEKLENAAVTFTMKDVATGILQVANAEGEVLLKDGCDENGEKEYYIAYRFTQDDTCQPGIYEGQFQLTFMDDETVLITPIAEDLEIHVLGSFMKVAFGEPVI